MNNNSKRDMNFFSRERVTRYTKQNISKRPLHLLNSENIAISLTQFFVLFSITEKFLDCGASLSRPVRFDLCPTNASVTVSFGQRHR